ncbi:MAG: PEP-CTERM system TPR-repeat protein PrsT [Gammaproteobacteria bacterium]|nr:PEP-CTERM system TPR-repeat protein PrsT [Gammaproteobacteria bacterium]
MKTISRFLLFAIVAVQLVACGLSVSDEDRLLRAERHMDQGEYRTASIDLKNVLAADPDNAKARILLGQVYLGLGEILNAEKEIRRAADLGASESSVRPLFLKMLIEKGEYTTVLAALSDGHSGLTSAQEFGFRGAALYGVNNLAAAEATYRDWIAEDPGNVSAVVGLSRVLSSVGRRTDAIAKLDALLKVDPDIADAWAELARIRFSLGEYAEAAKGFALALKNSDLETGFRSYYVTLAGLADSQLRAQLIEASRNSIALLTAMDKSATLTLLLSARLAQIDQDFPAAARYLQEIVARDPDDYFALMFLADIQMRQRNLAQAEELLNRVVAYAPDNIQARKLLARVQLRQSKPSGVVEALSPFLDSGDADVYGLVGQANLQRGNIDAAISNFRMAADSNPGGNAEQLNLAISYLFAGNNTMAIGLLVEQPEGKDGDYRREQLLLMAYMRSGKLAAANVIVEELEKGHSNDPEALSLAASFYFGVGKLDVAKSLYEKSLKLDSSNITALLGLARLEIQTGEFIEAGGILDTVRTLERGQLEATLGLAHIASIDGNYDAVYQLLMEAREYHPNDVRPVLALALAYFRNDSVDLALATAREAVMFGSQDPSINAAVGRVLMETGAYDEALVAYEIAVNRAPNSPRLLMALGYTYLALDRSVDAQSVLARALKIDPELEPAAAALILVELRQGRYNSALIRVQKLRKKLPDRVVMMLLEGEVYSKRGEHISAADAYARAVQKGAGSRAVFREYQSRVLGEQSRPEAPLVDWLAKNPDDGQARRLLGERYQATGRSLEAIQQYERLIESNPDDGELLNNLAWEYLTSGDLERARAAAEKARKLLPDSGSVTDTLGWIYRSLGEMDRSEALLREARSLSASNGEIEYHLAVVLAETGKRDESREILGDLLVRGASFPSIDAASILLNELSSAN